MECPVLGDCPVCFYQRCSEKLCSGEWGPGVVLLYAGKPDINTAPKILYNIFLLSLLSLLTWLGFSFVAGNPVKETAQFFGVIFLGATGFSITFTFVSAISSKADSSSTLMAILGFPLIIPILLTLIKLSANALRLMRDTAIEKDVMILVSIDLLLLGVALVLFPFLWRD